MPRLLRLASALVTLALVAISSAAAGSASDAAARERQAAPSWQHLPALDHGHGAGLTAAAWSAGRLWFVVGSRRQLLVSSARVASGALTSHQTTRAQAPLSWYPLVVGAEVAYSASRSALGVAPLLPNGRLGPTATPSPDPLESNVGYPVAAARIGERIVWVLMGGRPVGEGLNFRPTLQVCCDETGVPRNLSDLATLRMQSPPRAHSLGLDAKGRMWLAWVDGRRGRAEVRMVELDPSTLAPRTRRALIAPIQRVAYPHTRTQALPLVCAATCRVVVSSSHDLPTGGGVTRIATWAPGERAATIVDLPRAAAGDHDDALLVAAAVRGGKLAIAYRQDVSEPRARLLRVVIGDAQGRSTKLVGSVSLPEKSRGQPIWLFSAGAFSPTGFVFGQSYSNYGRRGHVLATVIPLR